MNAIPYLALLSALMGLVLAGYFRGDPLELDHHLFRLLSALPEAPDGAYVVRVDERVAGVVHVGIQRGAQVARAGKVEGYLVRAR